MYECPNCSANMKFNIPRQAMFCEACGTTKSPYEVSGKSAEENQSFEINVFTCPQCGGEIVADTNEAMTFCLYCGASTVLESRLETIERPAKIIPFKKTKEDCVAAYKKALKSAAFTDKAARAGSSVNSFRGIYMPFWNYKAKVKQNVSFEAEGATTRRGDFLYTKIYSVTGQVDAEYEGFAHDASSSFPDRLSEVIAPFDLREAVEFTSAYMSGFYGDAGDIEERLYQGKAFVTVQEDVTKKLVRAKPVRSYRVNAKSVKTGINPEIDDCELIMLPVWFMSARHKDEKGEDRITYSVVNGQTGSLASEMPVSKGRVLIVGFAIALVLFILGNLIDFNIMPRALSFIALILTVISVIIVNSQKKKISQAELGEDDMGFSHVKQAQDSDNRVFENAIAQATAKKKMSLETGLLLAYIAATILMHLWDPASDLWYFGLALAGLAYVAALQIKLIARLNRLATRPLPQFKRKGGDDGVK